MHNISAVAKIKAKKDFVNTVLKELLTLVEPTRKEKGCISYDLHRDNDDDSVFVFYEVWKNSDCLAKHIKSKHFVKCFEIIESHIENVSINQLTKL